ncbi:hypothetical protein ACHAWF_007766 [Thalassiosira exigua]
MKMMAATGSPPPTNAGGASPTPEEQCEALWTVLWEHNRRGQREGREERNQRPRERVREWPSYDSVIADITSSDYSEHLQCPHDLRFINKGNKGGGKTICPHGVLCRAKIEMFQHTTQQSKDKPYTGLLTPGRTMEHCIVRLSSAMRPPNDVVKNPVAKAVLRAAGNKLRNANLFPCCAIKAFRGGNIRSGNLLFMGSKVGQSEKNYFQYCQCTQLTGRMNLALKPLLKSFWKYSDHPLSLGLSDYCSFDADGHPPAEGVHFPYILILKPMLEGLASGAVDGSAAAAVCPQNSTAISATKKGESKKSKSSDEQPFDAFLDQMEKIEPGTILFDIFCCPEPAAVPDPSRLQRIGRIVSTSEMIPSFPDDNIFFRHQRREEDFALRSGWKEDSKKVKCSVGKERSSVAKLAGWELFEEQIAMKQYVDFEDLAS